MQVIVGYKRKKEVKSHFTVLGLNCYEDKVATIGDEEIWGRRSGFSLAHTRYRNDYLILGEGVQWAVRDMNLEFENKSQARDTNLEVICTEMIYKATDKMRSP